MNKIISRIVANPAVLLWLVLAAFVCGSILAGGAAWKFQGMRLDATKAEYKGFVATVKAQGEAAQTVAKAQAERDKKLKEGIDREHQTDIARLTADNQRLRNERAHTNYVPAAPAGSRSPNLACFDRTELERALQQFDKGISGILGEGDAATVGLNTARTWAQSK
jgi:hypothetical protein